LLYKIKTTTGDIHIIAKDTGAPRHFADGSACLSAITPQWLVNMRRAKRALVFPRRRTLPPSQASLRHDRLAPNGIDRHWGEDV
jgi:hypothetical protein